MRFPVSRASARANSSWRSSSRAATLSRKSPRSGAGTEVHTPESKEARAAAMARSESAPDPSETVATCSPVPGQVISRVPPSAAGAQAPLM